MNPFIRLHPADDVVIARTQLVGGTQLADESVTVTGLVPPGHKVATRALRAGTRRARGRMDGPRGGRDGQRA